MQIKPIILGNINGRYGLQLDAIRSLCSSIETYRLYLAVIDGKPVTDDAIDKFNGVLDLQSVETTRIERGVWQSKGFSNPACICCSPSIQTGEHTYKHILPHRPEGRSELAKIWASPLFLFLEMAATDGVLPESEASPKDDTTEITEETQRLYSQNSLLKTANGDLFIELKKNSGYHYHPVPIHLAEIALT